MRKIQIEVSKAVLFKMDNLGFNYKVLQDDIELRALLFPCGSSQDELDDYEKEQIFDCAIEAIKKGDDYGILIETLSGRNMQDHRCYELDDVTIVPVSEADITVKKMLSVLG